MKGLDELMIKFGSDKASVAVPAGHNYCVHYEQVFEKIRYESIKLLEIGVGSGVSVQGWIEYFPNAQIFGVDTVSGTNPWNTLKLETDARYTFVNGDQSDLTFWKCFIADYGTYWDVVVDDGSHYASHVITTFDSLWPHVRRGGLYCIEDLACSYGGAPFVKDGPSHMDWIRSKMDEMNATSDIDSLNFSKELAIFRKT